MKDLLISITKGLVENPDAISVDVSEPDEEGVIVYHLHVSEDDMGITTRIALAILPCFPITLPISSSDT